MAPIKLAVFAHDKVFCDVNNEFLEVSKKELKEKMSFIDEALQFDEYVKYVTEQFAKHVDPVSDYEYIISATIAEMIMYASNLDGVLYPSVQAAGEHGMNIALRPDVADEKLFLKEVREMEYSQNQGKGLFKFLKKYIPVTTDYRGLLQWNYFSF